MSVSSPQSAPSFDYRNAQIDFAAPLKRKKDVRIFINGKANVKRGFYVTENGQRQNTPIFKTDAEGYLYIRTVKTPNSSPANEAGVGKADLIYKPVKMSSRYGFTYKNRTLKADLSQGERMLRTFKDLTVGAVKGDQYLDIGADAEFIRKMIRESENGKKDLDYSKNPVIKRLNTANSEKNAVRNLYAENNTRRELSKSGDAALRNAFYTGVGGAALTVFIGVSAVTAGAAAPAIIAFATPFLLAGTGAEVARSRSGTGTDDFIRSDKAPLK